MNQAEIREKIKNKNNELLCIIKRTKIVTDYAYNINTIMEEKYIELARESKKVLDIGKSSRNFYKLFKSDQIVTADINSFDDYPDILCDICDAETLPTNRFDAIICNAVIEHVYNPSEAVKNMYNLLEDKGKCICYIPFTFPYHAPKNLKFQDYYRFTSDGIAILFKDFKDVTLFSVRGRTTSALLYAIPKWKKIEKIMGKKIKYIDYLGGKYSKTQVSGYVVWAKK